MTDFNSATCAIAHVAEFSTNNNTNERYFKNRRQGIQVASFRRHRQIPLPEIMLEAIKASESEMITVAMKRVNLMNEATDDMLTHINRENVQLPPNTSGVRNAQEAVMAAQMSREIF